MTIDTMTPCESIKGHLRSEFDELQRVAITEVTDAVIGKVSGAGIDLMELDQIGQRHIEDWPIHRQHYYRGVQAMVRLRLLEIMEQLRAAVIRNSSSVTKRVEHLATLEAARVGMNNLLRQIGA